MRQGAKAFVLAAGAMLMVARAAGQQFQLMEASIDEIHRGLQSGKLTCHSLVQQYLDRVKAYDQQGPTLNAMLYVNPKVVEQADAMDRQLRGGAKLKPLQCVPVVLKDNFDTADMPTTGASLALQGMQPSKDAFTVARLRQNGALILGKTNMHELALAGLTASSLGGQTRNPYELSRTPGGSSGGTGVALAANFATVGTGSDTVNSIRSPASANSLVGIRPTRGLISRTGLIPVSFTQDAAGPLARSVADVAVMLDVMAGYDPDDPVTALGIGRIPATYTASLDRHGLRDVRLGVLHTLFGTGPDHQEVNRVMAHALEVLKGHGAILVDIDDAAFDTGKLNSDLDVQKYEYKFDLNNYLKAQPDPPVHSLAELIALGKYHKASLEKFLASAESYENGLNEPDYKDRRIKIDDLRVRLANLMAKNDVVAMVYPHQKRLPVMIGEMNQVERNGILASLAGFPAITVPAGFSSATESAPIGVPVGIEFLGQPFTEPKLLQIAYGFEQATHARKPPQSAPPLNGR
ncbi:MAG TPA: amidase family protein [Terriglobales bacterium]|nr:amidase family protein [Terriglobales bacterium]